MVTPFTRRLIVVEFRFSNNVKVVVTIMNKDYKGDLVGVHCLILSDVVDVLLLFVTLNIAQRALMNRWICYLRNQRYKRFITYT